MPVFNIHHITRYEYDRPVKESVNEIRIFPYSGPGQETLHQQLDISMHPDILEVNDYWGNRTGMFNLMASHQQLQIESRLVVRTLGQAVVDPEHKATLSDLRTAMAGDLRLLELSLIREAELKESLSLITAAFYEKGLPVSRIVQNCSHFIFSQFQYIKGITNIETTVAEILQHRSGVCQDFAHVMLELLRSVGIPSRYVSGYICPNKNGMRGEGATHAWVEAWIPALGWTGIDPTNDVWVTNHHVKLAVGRHFNDCSPVKGTFKGPARQSLSVYVSVGYEDGQTFEEMNDVKMQTLHGPRVVEQPQQ